jgi:hypothetical protein
VVDILWFFCDYIEGEFVIAINEFDVLNGDVRIKVCGGVAFIGYSLNAKNVWA